MKFISLFFVGVGAGLAGSKQPSQSRLRHKAALDHFYGSMFHLFLTHLRLLQAQALVMALVISTVEPLRLLEEKGAPSRDQENALRSLVNMLMTATKNGRRLNAKSLSKARGMYKEITRDMTKSQIKKWLRQEATADEETPSTESIAVRKEQASLVEKELKTALVEHKSALLDRPFVEQQGNNDFLVMKPDKLDPFVTVIPNAIYYNIEKKCVNWLDDCSLRGIRARLLRGVQSP